LSFNTTKRPVKGRLQASESFLHSLNIPIFVSFS